MIFQIKYIYFCIRLCIALYVQYIDSVFHFSNNHLNHRPAQQLSKSMLRSTYRTPYYFENMPLACLSGPCPVSNRLLQTYIFIYIAIDMPMFACMQYILDLHQGYATHSGGMVDLAMVAVVTANQVGGTNSWDNQLFLRRSCPESFRTGTYAHSHDSIMEESTVRFEYVADSWFCTYFLLVSAWATQPARVYIA